MIEYLAGERSLRDGLAGSSHQILPETSLTRESTSIVSIFVAQIWFFVNQQ